jgi:hypothetical protein
MGLHPGSIPSQAPISAHQIMMPRMPEDKQGFPSGFMPNQAFTRPEVQAEHPRPVTTVSSSEKQPPVTSSAPTCVVHPITSANSKEHAFPYYEVVDLSPSFVQLLVACALVVLAGYC